MRAVPVDDQRPAITIRRIGVVRHPSRDVGGAVGAVERWAAGNGAAVVPAGEPGWARDCDVVVAVGGDGTVLAAVRAAAAGRAPVLGVACGSLGALTAVDADRVPEALDALVAGPWDGRGLPALQLDPDAGETVIAFNDLVVTRAAGSQVRVEVLVDDVRYARWAGDGVVAATALGSSAYTMALGGPLLTPGAPVVVVTPVAPHGGAIPPLVVPDTSAVELRVDGGHGGARVELDGRPSRLDPERVRLSLHPDAVVLVRPEHGEPFLSSLRRRGLVADSPRILAHERRLAREAGTG